MVETRYLVPDAEHPYDRPITGEIKDGYFSTCTGRFPAKLPLTALKARKIGIRELKREIATNPKAQEAIKQLHDLIKADANEPFESGQKTIAQFQEEVLAATKAIENDQLLCEQELANLKNKQTERRRLLEQAEHEAETRTIRAALTAADWKVHPAAVLLGVSHMTLTRLLSGKQQALGLELARKRMERRNLK